jgi:hypothetical protein
MEIFAWKKMVKERKCISLINDKRQHIFFSVRSNLRRFGSNGRAFSGNGLETRFDGGYRTS